MTEIKLSKERLDNYKRSVDSLINTIQESRDRLDSDDPYMVLRTYSRLLPILEFASISASMTNDMITTALALAHEDMPDSSDEKHLEEQQTLKEVSPIHHALTVGLSSKSHLQDLLNELKEALKQT